MCKHKDYMAHAIELSVYNVKRGGGPFGAVIVKDGEIVGEGFNEVTASNDPTAHAEVVAIRNAARKLQSFDLSGCTIYTSCEPCPMCLGAIYWAKIDRMYYGNTKMDADQIGFNDDFIYKEIGKPLGERQLSSIPLMREEALAAFRLWNDKSDKTEY